MPASRAEIQTLVKRLAEGDRTAIAPSFGALWPVLRSFSARALGAEAEADADDAAQEALTKVFAQAAEFDPRRDALAWALTIAAYECRTLRRRKARRREVTDDELWSLATTGATPEELAIERDLESAVREAVRALSDADASSILAAFGEGSRPSDATFRKRLQRALARLRLAWRAKHEAE